MSGARPRDFRGPFRTDLPARAVYAESAGVGRILPRAVAVPADAEDVATLVRWAAAEGVPLVPRGSGSSMANGAIGPGVVVDLSRLNRIGAPDVERRTIRVGPGALRNDVDIAAAKAGLRFPPNPSSGAYCSVGGMAGTNAAGAHSLGHGAMRKWVAALDCVLADGSRARIARGATWPTSLPPLGRALALLPELQRRAGAVQRRGVRKDSSGYAVDAFLRSGDLVDLLVGSEGTLALFTELELRLVPRPGATRSLLAAFPSLETAVRGAIVAADHGAAACELLDRTFLDVVAGGGGMGDVTIPEGSEAVLIAEVEAEDEEAARAKARRVADGFRDAGAHEVTTAERVEDDHALWEFRHAASPLLARLDPALKSMQFIEDSAVPPERLPELVRGVREALDRRGMRGVIFGHAGDAHVHVNPLVDVRRPDWRAQVESLLAEVATLTTRLGGTLSAEHGDGRLRAPLLRESWGEEAVALFARVKEAFDPQGILNPGVIVAAPGQRPLGDIKYDPELEPLPAEARAVLDRVARERGYGGFRLALLEEAEGERRTANGEPS